MTQPYTFYDAKGSAEIVVNRVPKTGGGRVWVRGRYSEEVQPSPLDVRVGRGIKVWELIRDLRSVNNDINALLALHAPHIDAGDVEAAVKYFDSYAAEIERKIAEELAVA